MAKVTTNFRTIDRTNSYPAFAVSTTAIAKTIPNRDCTIKVNSGNLFIRTNGTATTSDLKLVSGDVIDLHVCATLSVISDSSGANVQVITWED